MKEIVFISIVLFCVVLACYQQNSLIDNPFDQFDAIYYINLEHRKDRNENMKRVFRELNIPQHKIHRINAYYTKENGYIGSAMSHRDALKDGMKYNKIIIFEDDATINKQGINSFTETLDHFKNNWDVIQLGGHGWSTKPYSKFCKKCIKVTVTNSYAVNKHMIPVLYKNSLETIQALKEEMKDPRKHTSQYSVNNGKVITTDNAIDQTWTKLQPSYKWYLLEPKLIEQGKSKSDIVS